MKSFRQLLQLPALAVLFSLNAVQGAVFNYSYTFGDGLAVSGSLSGTQNGNFVDNVSNVTLLFNGTAVPGSIFAARYDGTSPNQYVAGPVVSFDALQNNFVFANSNLAGGDFSYDSIFYMLNTSVFDFNTAVGLSLPLNHFGSQDLPTVPGAWSLAAVGGPTGVPDGGSTLTLLGLCLAGLGWMRRRR